MTRRNHDTHHRDRQRIAAATAKRLAEYGSQGDPDRIRRQVARELDIIDPRALPDREEIEAALAEHLRLFGPAGRTDHLRTLREAALEAMRFLHHFSPRLVGPVLDGNAGQGSVIELHLHEDVPEDVAAFLTEHGIPSTQGSRRIRLDHDQTLAAPTHHFLADGLPVNLIVLPRQALRQPPLDRLGDGPLPRADQNRLRTLLGETTGLS